MHELSITQNILDVVLDAAQKAGAPRVAAINLVIGELTSVVDDSVQFYFDFLSRDTLAEGAELRFKRLSAMATCLDCGHQFNVRAPLLILCPACDSPRLQVTGGREFLVESIEVDDGNSSC